MTFEPPEGRGLLERLIFPLLNGCYWLAGHQRWRVLTTFLLLFISFVVVPYIGFWACVPTLIYGTMIGYTSAVHHMVHHKNPLVRAFSQPTEERP